jgi:hypothetical protein
LIAAVIENPRGMRRHPTFPVGADTHVVPPCEFSYVRREIGWSIFARAPMSP